MRTGKGAGSVFCFFFSTVKLHSKLLLMLNLELTFVPYHIFFPLVTVVLNSLLDITFYFCSILTENLKFFCLQNVDTIIMRNVVDAIKQEEKNLLFCNKYIINFQKSKQSTNKKVITKVVKKIGKISAPKEVVFEFFSN